MLAPDDVEVKTEYRGICHSDLSMIDNEWGFSSYPLIAGHEVVGHVRAPGEATKNKGFKTGPRVEIGWMAQSCQHCNACISNNPINCQDGSTPIIINKERFANRLRCHWL